LKKSNIEINGYSVESLKMKRSPNKFIYSSKVSKSSGELTDSSQIILDIRFREYYLKSNRERSSIGWGKE
jgi:hypothetical protein